MFSQSMKRDQLDRDLLRSTGVQPANPAFTMSNARNCFARFHTLAISKLMNPSFVFRLSAGVPGVARTQPRLRAIALRRAVFTRFASEAWWSRSGSNRRPQACKARALPTELRPRSMIGGDDRCLKWWARDELNVRPHAYQACALTT